MVAWVDSISSHLWHNGLAVIPLVILVTLLVRWLPSRPATRHTLWVMILLWLVLPPMLPSLSGSSISEWMDSKLENTNPQSDENNSEELLTYENPRRLPTSRELIVPVAPPAAHPAQHPRKLPTSRDFIPPTAQGVADKIVSTPSKWTRPSARRLGVYEGRAANEQDFPAIHPLSPAPKTLARERLRNGCGPMVGDYPPCRSLYRFTDKITTLEQPTRLRSGPPSLSLANQYKVRLLHTLAKNGYALFNKYFEVDDDHEPAMRHEPTTRIAAANTNTLEPNKPEALQSNSKNCPLRAATSQPKPPTRTSWSTKNDTKVFTAINDIQTPSATSNNGTSIQAWAELTVWVTAMYTAWESMIAIPPIPTSLWFGVAMILIAIVVIRSVHFHKRLASAQEAPRAVRRLITEVADEIGLRSAPQTLMVDGRISPMIWCSLKPKLILPVRLWSQLDDQGRRAVVFHELAHLRRGDHWVNWIDTAIGNLFWWHPLVWWVRYRLHSEAEDCCDAWVTTLMPQKRRAYAETLLKTKQYLGAGHTGVAVMGIGITSGRARRFARRLTMVMTQSVKPRLSISGFALVMALAMTGWLASPAQSNEPNAKAEVAQTEKTDVVEAKVKPVVVYTQVQPQTSDEAVKRTYRQASKLYGEAVAVGTNMSFVQPARVAPAIAVMGLEKGNKNKKSGKRIKKLEQKLEQLSKQLEELSESMDRGPVEIHGEAHRHRRGPRDGRSHADQAPRAPRAPREPRALRAPRAPRAHRAPKAPKPTHPIHPGHGPHGHQYQMFKGDHPFPGPRGLFFGDDSEATWKTYRLAEGKLEAFTELMIRSDVPIMVRPKPKAIDILGTPRQHALWNGFFQMIDPSDKRTSESRDFFQPFFAKGNWGPFGSGCCGKSDCKKRCQSKGKDSCGGGCGSCNGIGFNVGCDTPGCDKCKSASKMKIKARKIRNKVRKELTEIRAKTRGNIERIRDRAREEVEHVRERIRFHARNARAQAHSHRDMNEALMLQEEALRDQAREMLDQAQRVREQAEEVRERASEIADDESQNEGFERHVREMEAHSAQLEAQSRMLEEQSREIEENARKIEEQVEEMERHADELDERAEAIRDASDALNDSESSPELANSIIALAHYVDEVANPVLTKTSKALQSLIESASEVSQVDEKVETPSKNDQDSDD